MSILDETVLTMPRGVRIHFDKVRDGWVLLAPERAIHLDQVGHAILMEVDGTRNFGEIAAGLAKKFDAPLDQIVGDASGFLRALMNRRFLDATQ